MSNIGKHSVQTSLDTAGYHAGTLAMIKDVQAMALATGQSYDQVARTIDQGIAHRKAAALEQGRIDKKAADEAAKGAGGGFFGALSKLKVGVGQGEGGISGIMGSLGDIKDVAGAMGKWGLALGLAAGGLLALETATKAYVKSGMEAIVMQEKMAQRLGVTSAQSAAMIAVGRASGQDAGEVQSASVMGLRHVGELRTDLAGGGTGGAAGASLRALGIDPAQFAAMSSWTQQVGVLGDALKNVASGADKAHFAQAILGRGYEALMPQLRAGSAGMAEAARLAEHFGVVVGGEARDSILGTASAAREFRVASGLAADGLRNQFTVGFELATRGARNYRDATQELIRLQPDLAASMREAGAAAGTVMGGVESAAVKILAGWQKIFNLFRDAPPPPGEVRGVDTRPQAEIEASSQWQREAGERAIALHRGRVEALSAQIAATPDGADRDALIDSRNWQAGLLQRARMEQARLPDAPTQATLEQMTIGGQFGLEQLANEGASNGAAITALGEQTQAIERINQAWGLTAEQMQRARAIQAGMVEGSQELARFDAAMAERRRQERGDREAAALEAAHQRDLAMVQQARSPAEVMRDRLYEIIRAQGLTDLQRGRLIEQAAGGAITQTPLLGSLSAGSSEVGAIFQQMQTPQIDKLASIEALIESLVEEQERTADATEALGTSVNELYRLANAA